MSGNDVVEFYLPDGALLLARVERLSAERIDADESDEDSEGTADVAVRDFLSFRHVSKAVKGLVGELHQALAGASPDLVSVELGFDLAVKGSQLLALVADAGTQASVRVRLEWRRGRDGAAAAAGSEVEGDGGADSESAGE